MTDRFDLDVAGIGVGPFNLSLAALLEPHRAIRARFFERAPHFAWHPGQLFAEATVQVSYLKDLVTLVDPTSRWSFLAFLARHGRLYRFINANFSRVSRREFSQYLGWVAASLDSLEFGTEVLGVDVDGDAFAVETATGRVRARNVVLGTGLLPLVPDCARVHLGRSVFHASRFLSENAPTRQLRVAVVGGGQTGAEIVQRLLGSAALPRELHWISRRSNFLALDESAFVNELFSPGYSDYFFHLPAASRLRLLKEQKLASDGISATLLEQIYRRLYELEFVEGEGRICRLHPGRELVGVEPAGDGWRLVLHDPDGGGAHEEVLADVVVLGTGFEYRLPPALDPLRPRLKMDGPELAVRDDFSVECDAPAGLRLFVQNGAKRRRGIADPNLSLMAWRSAVIANSIAAAPLYEVDDRHCLFAREAHDPLAAESLLETT